MLPVRENGCTWVLSNMSLEILLDWGLAVVPVVTAVCLLPEAV